MSPRLKNVTILAEPSFERSLGDLPLEEQRGCLVAISWFERECEEDQRSKSSWKVGSAERRRIRCVRASKQTVVLYAVSNSGQNWVWAGWHGAAEDAGGRIDASPIENPEPIDVDVMLANLKEGSRIEGPAPDDVDAWSNAVEDAALAITDARSLVSRIKSRLTDRLAAFDQLVTTSEAARAESVKLSTEADAKIKETEAKLAAAEKAARPPADGIEARLASVISHHNAARAEVERLKAENKSLATQVRLARAELTKQQVDPGKLKAALERVEQLEQEVGNLKAASKKEALAAMTDLIVEGIQEQCSKVLDDAANRLAATERPTDEIQAEHLRRLAMKVRALKVKVKA